jgi:hypothetical protein
MPVITNQGIAMVQAFQMNPQMQYPIVYMDTQRQTGELVQGQYPQISMQFPQQINSNVPYNISPSVKKINKQSNFIVKKQDLLI